MPPGRLVGYLVEQACFSCAWIAFDEQYRALAPFRSVKDLARDPQFFIPSSHRVNPRKPWRPGHLALALALQLHRLRLCNCIASVRPRLGAASPVLSRNKIIWPP